MRKLICVSVLGSIFLAASALAADKEEQAIRVVIVKAIENWSAMNVDANDAFYVPDPKAVWYDLTPMQYAGWSAYKEGVKKLSGTLDSLSLKLHDDVAIQRRGKVAWVTYTFATEIRPKGGKAQSGEARATDILEKRGGKWMIVHEHVSFPAPM